MKQHVTILLLCASVLSVVGQSRYYRAEELYEEALDSYKSKSLTQAEHYIEESLYVNPTAESNYLAGLIYESLDKNMKALTAYEATLKYDPEYNEAIFQKAIIYMNHGDAGQAVEDFTYLINNKADVTRSIYFQTDPNGNVQTQVVSLANIDAQLYHYRGQAYQRMVKYDEALKDYNEALKRDTAADFYISRALLYTKLGDEDWAVGDLESALDLEPNNQFAWYNLALMKPEINLPDTLLREAAFAPTLGLLGTRALEEGKYEQAMRYFQMYLKNNKYDALAYVNRGRVYLKQNDLVNARNDFETARELDPARNETLYLMGNSYFLEKEYESALAFYNQYLAIDPTNGLVWYNGAMSYMELDRPNEACHFLNNAKLYGMEQASVMIGKHCNVE